MSTVGISLQFPVKKEKKLHVLILSISLTVTWKVKELHPSGIEEIETFAMANKKLDKIIMAYTNCPKIIGLVT